MLSVIKDYTMTTESKDFYDITGISTKYIDITLNRLQTIKTKTIIAKRQQSEKANAWNKAHPERHREINRDSARRNSKKKGVR